ncbi:MAG: IclR family transcriptional regulator [Haloarculaceae archaeon]
MHADDDPPIKSTAFSFDLLEAVHDRGEVTLPAIVDEFDMPKSTVHDHLTTLTRMGYLVNEDGTYRLSLRFLNFGGRVRSRFQFFQVAESKVRELAKETGEHANLMVEENGKGVFLYKVKGSESVNLDTYEGMEVSLHTTAMGKAILAELPAEKRDAILDRHGLPAVTDNTITDRAELMEDLERTRERGYAIDNEERLPGIRCVAAAISTDERVVGGLSISAPRRRMSDERFEETIPVEVLRTANIIEVNLQHS